MHTDALIPLTITPAPRSKELVCTTVIRRVDVAMLLIACVLLFYREANVVVPASYAVFTR